MALEAPAPRLLFRRSAEDRDEIIDRVAATSRRVFFQFLEDDLERPDTFGAQETALPQSAAEQRETEVTLSFGQVLERQTLTGDGSEKPVLTFGIGERVGGLLRLIGAQRGEEFLGGAKHIDRRRMSAGECGEDEEAEGGEEDARGGTHDASNALERAGRKLAHGDDTPGVRSLVRAARRFADDARGQHSPRGVWGRPPRRAGTRAGCRVRQRDSAVAVNTRVTWDSRTGSNRPARERAR